MRIEGQNKLSDFIPFPRKMAVDFRDGKITPNELLVWSYLRLNTNPYGLTATSLSSINEDLFRGKNKVSDNYINKTLISLKENRYIFYEKRAGKKGTFNIHFGDIALPHGKGIRTLDKLFAEEKQKDDPKQSQRLETDNQRCTEIKREAISLSQKFSINKVRGSHTDTNNEKENYNHQN